MQTNRGLLILLLGIAGLIGFLPCAPLAWYLGDRDMCRMREGEMERTSQTITNLGRILGMTVTILVGVFMAGMPLARWLLFP